MASIHVRDNGKFQAKVRKAGHNVSKTFDSRESAVDWAKRFEAGLARYTHNVSNNHRMTELAPLLGFIPKRVLNALSNVPYTTSDILDASLDAAVMTGVYFLIDKNEIVYVGQSKTNILDRIAKHKRNGRQFERYAYIQCEHGQIDNLERMYIEAFFPSGNISTSNSSIKV